MIRPENKGIGRPFKNCRFHCKIEIMAKKNLDDSLDHIRHSLAHLLAAAVLKKFPDAKLAIGPTIENGFYYDFLLPRTLTPEDLEEFEKTMRKLIGAKLVFGGKKVTEAEAKKLFKEQPFKLELIEEFAKEDKELTIYETKESGSPLEPSLTRLEPAPYRDAGRGRRGETPKTQNLTPKTYFVDLCRGGHVLDTSEIPADGFKLDKIAGAYWRGSEKNPQLQRIYGLAFASKKELDEYLRLMEEAKKRDHRKLGAELDLFAFSDLVGPGLAIWTTKGTIIRDELEKFAKETEAKWGYKRIATPHIAKAKLFETSGHLPYYEDDMYPGMKLDDATYYLKAMNCPITMALFAQKPHSYRELPLRLAEFGTVYRYERSGVLTGLLRVRGFTQNDAHIFCAESQLEDEFVRVMKLHEYYYRDVFGIKDYYIRLSLRDKTKKDKFGGNEEIWQKAESIIRSAIKKSGVPFEEALGEASFYGPKADFQIKSAIGKEETASTNQIDFIMPARFGLKYIGGDGKEHPVVAIHRAPLGSHERFIGFLIEHFGGAFPVWLAPVQVAVLAVGEKFSNYGKKVCDTLIEAGIRSEWNDPTESLGKRIREAGLQKIPYILVVGEKEEKEGTVAVRSRSSSAQRATKDKKGDDSVVKLETFLKKIREEIEKKTL